MLHCQNMYNKHVVLTIVSEELLLTIPQLWPRIPKMLAGNGCSDHTRNCKIEPSMAWTIPESICPVRLLKNAMHKEGCW